MISAIIPNALQTSIENASPFVTTIGVGFFVGVLIGYALKKVVLQNDTLVLRVRWYERQI
ncbi:MAG TPA: hypothetical protein VFI73_06375 [Candidatus Nitrosopolaris sp.]|nr:hypothetical protein [Candidatus Nitrosopolaris sp.]